jgi:hypothetical protein
VSKPVNHAAAGLAGILGVACYLLAILIPWPESQFGTSAALLVVSAFPILSIVFCHGLCGYIAAEAPGAAVRLGFVFAVPAFATVLAMIIVQLAVNAALPDIARELDAPVRRALSRGLRMIDLGLDVAWDMLIGVALVCLGWAMRPRRGLGPGWGIPAMLLGAALILLNAATFPWPPADRGLFDIGPFVGVFILALAVRLTVLSRRADGQVPRASS